jgi:hypothetical protein
MSGGAIREPAAPLTSRGALALGVILLLPSLGADLQSRSVPGRAEEQRILRREQLGQVDRERWQSELQLEQIKPKLGLFFSALEAREFSPPWIQELFAKSFRGSPISGSGPGQVHREPNGVRVARLAPEPRPLLDREAFVEAWTRYAAGFATVERTEFHVSLVEGLPSPIPDMSRTRLDLDFRILGRQGEELREDQGSLEIELIRPPEAGWMMDSLSLTALESVRGTPQFSDISSRLPPSEPQPVEKLFVAYFAEGVALADFDADGDLDLFAPRRYSSAELHRNGGDASFQEVSEEVGLGGLLGVRSGYFFDWDNDGDLDLLVLTRRRIHLFEQAGGRFRDVSAASGVDQMSTQGLTGAAVADYDGDGFLDFYVTNYGDPARGPGFGYFDSHNGFFNKLFRNRGDGGFVDATDDAGLGRDNRRWSYAALWIDIDRDRAPDLYVVNDYGPNQLFRNAGDGSFAEVAKEVGVSDFGNGMAASWADYDNDGRMDLYVSNMHSYAGARITRAPGFGQDPEVRARGQRFAKGNTLLRNLGGGRFEEIEPSPAINARWAWGNLFFDYDNDGDQDLYVANGMFSNAPDKDT